LIEGQDDFLTEARDTLRAGLSSAAWITADDTGARHKATNGFCTQTSPGAVAQLHPTPATRLQFAVNISQRFQMPAHREEGPPAAAMAQTNLFSCICRRTFINPASSTGCIIVGTSGLRTRSGGLRLAIGLLAHLVGARPGPVTAVSPHSSHLRQPNHPRVGSPDLQHPKPRGSR
jgi:hypothetical protein